MKESMCKCNLRLQDTDIYQPLTINPFPELTRTFNVTEKENIPTNLINVVKEIFLSLSYFYGIPKVHKQGVPIRPIISCCSSVVSNLSKWLAKQLSPLLGTISGAHIKNSPHFINMLSEKNPLDHRLISFDVVSLFTKVLMDRFLDLFSTHFTKEIFRVSIVAFINLMKFCLTNIFFLFSWMSISNKFLVPAWEII